MVTVNHRSSGNLFRDPHPDSAYTAWNVSKYGSFSGPHFPAFELNTEIYFVNLFIQSEYKKLFSWPAIKVKFLFITKCKTLEQGFSQSTVVIKVNKSKLTLHSYDTKTTSEHSRENAKLRASYTECHKKNAPPKV